MNIKIIIIIIIVVIFIIINCLSYLKSCNTIIIKNPCAEVKLSPLLNYKERGLFATRDYNKGDTIEVCPTLIMVKDKIPSDNIIHEHLFQGNLKGNSLLALGYCSIINHSKDKQNCTWHVAKDDTYIIVTALTDIKKGDELYSNYGDTYWSTRNLKPE